MAGLPKGLTRGVLLGGMAAVLWRVLAHRDSRVAIGGLVLKRVGGIPFLGSRVQAVVQEPLITGVCRAVAEDLVAEARSGELLELNSAPGFLTVEMGQRARDLQITALDPSPHGVQITEAKVHAAGLGRQIKVAMGDAMDIPYPDESFDFAVSLGALHRWPAPGVVLGEILRVLRPGGKAWIYDWRREMPEEGWEMVREAIPPLGRPLFEAAVMAPWKAAYPESLIRDLAGKSPFGGAEIKVLPVDIAGMVVPAIIRIALRK